jgi:aminoglycoside phosphotransferase (APT) family kinase protein
MRIQILHVANPSFADKTTWKVVSPPPPLPVADADALLDPWRDGRSIVEVEPLTGGIMNWNYRIRLSGSAERFVLRFYDRMPESCAKEVRILAEVRDDVPVPHVLFSEPAPTRLAPRSFPPFCVLEFIDGISLRELRRRGETAGVAEASYDAGRLLPRLMRHRFPRTGLLSPDLTVEDGSFADVSLLGIVEHFAASPLFAARVDAALRTRIESFVRAHEGLSAWPSPSPTEAGAGGATLAHGDFNSPNILVRQEGGRWTVAAILDWEFAFAGSILIDIGNMLRYERPGQSRYEPHFSRGLADAGVDLPDDWFLRARLADLPALCELLTREDVPDAVVAELKDLIGETVSI